MIITIQGGPYDGDQITVPTRLPYLEVAEEPEPISMRLDDNIPLSTTIRTLQLPLEHIAADHYLARWPIREDPRFCPQCACPPDTATEDHRGWECTCRFGHTWQVQKRQLRRFPPYRWPVALRPGAK